MNPSDAPASWGPAQNRTVTWWDPAVTAAAAREMSGLEFMTAMANGEVPPAPITRMLCDFDFTSVEPGRVEVQVTPDPTVYNPIGMVHGGFACTLLDSVTGCAVHTTLPAGTAYTSIEIKVSYLRAISADSGLLTARGWVTKPGRRVAFADGELVDAQGRVLATASSSCLVMGEA